jgi:hypothetical protein
VWFCKHLKYCGVDNELAQAIVSVEDDDSEAEEEGAGGRKYTRRGMGNSEYYKDTPDRLRVTGETC